jgi:hypothetical protein
MEKWECDSRARQLFIDFQKAYDSTGREVLYNFLSAFRVTRKGVGLIKIWLNDTYSAVRIRKNLTSFLTVAFKITVVTAK